MTDIRLLGRRLRSVWDRKPSYGERPRLSGVGLSSFRTRRARYVLYISEILKSVRTESIAGQPRLYLEGGDASAKKKKPGFKMLGIQWR